MTPTLTRPVSLLTVWLLGSSALFAADPVFLRVKPAAEPVYAGQNVRFTIDLLTTTTFASAATFDLPKLSGALVMPPDDRPLLGTETVDDVSYTVQTHELRFIAIRPGSYTVPSFDIRFESPPEFGKPPVEHTLRTTPLTITANAPPGAEKYKSVLCSRDLKLEERWQPHPPTAAKVGDTFTRTVTLSAGDMPGMLLPPVPLNAPKGLKVYRDPPSVADHSARGLTTSQRLEVATYVCEAPGPVDLPGIVLPWWNLDSSRLEQASLPPVKFEIQPSSAQRSATGPPARRDWSNAWTTMAAVSTAAIAAAVGVWLLLSGRLDRFCRPERLTEDRLFHALERNCHRNDASASVTSLYAWLDRRSPENVVATWSRFSTNSKLASLIDELEQAAFLNTAWDGSRLAASLSSVQRMGTENYQVRGYVSLPALNPPIERRNRAAAAESEFERLKATRR